MGLLPAGIGTPDARKRACPVRGALDGNLLSKGSKALSFDPGDFITALFYEVDEQLRAIPKHPEAHLWPSEVVTLGLLHALKAEATGRFIVGSRATIAPCFPAYPSGPGSFASSRPMKTGRRSSWPPRRCSGLSTRMGSN